MEIIIPNDNETYQEYIDRILASRENIKDNDNYQERHHIVPKCMNGPNDKENLIWLYAQEHYYAHKLLALENPNNCGLQCAWFRMCFAQGQHDLQVFISSEEYALARENYSSFLGEEMKGSNNPMYGKHLSSVHKNKISSALSGDKGYWYGKNFSEEHRKKLSRAKIGNKCHLNKHHSDESKVKISSGNKGKKRSEETLRKRSIPVVCIETLKVYYGAHEAEKRTSVCNEGINRCCTGKRKTAGGYHWQYYEDYIKEHPEDIDKLIEAPVE